MSLETVSNAIVTIHRYVSSRDMYGKKKRCEAKAQATLRRYYDIRYAGRWRLG
jgi:hypothetical protein